MSLPFLTRHIRAVLIALCIRDLMFGNRRHFRELLIRSEERIASNILADRLTRLEKAGLVSRRDDPSHKQTVIYSLTEASIALVLGQLRLRVEARKQRFQGLGRKPHGG